MADPSPSILKNPNFRALLLTRLLSMSAVQAQVIITGWQVYSLTHSPFLLGLTGLVEAVPAILCALFAGHIVDTHNPVTIYRYVLGVLAVTNIAFLIVAGGYIALEPQALLLFIFAGIFVIGLATSFMMPTGFALTAMILKRSEFSAASAWQGSAYQFASIGAPAIAGIIYGFYGAHGAWLMPALLMSMALVFSFFLRAAHKAKTREERLPALQSIREGWKFLLENNALLSIMALDMLAVLLGGAVAMLPAFADQILHVGAEGLGLLRAAPAAGAMLVSFYLGLRPMRRITAHRMLIVVAGFGVCMIGFGLSASFWLSMAMLALSGGFDSVSMVIRGTLTQLLTPDGLRGRVSAVNSMFIITSNEIGAFESGVAASLIGLAPSVILGGIGTIVVVIATALLSPKFRKLSVEA